MSASSKRKCDEFYEKLTNTCISVLLFVAVLIAIPVVIHGWYWALFISPNIIRDNCHVVNKICLI